MLKFANGVEESATGSMWSGMRGLFLGEFEYVKGGCLGSCNSATPFSFSCLKC